MLGWIRKKLPASIPAAAQPASRAAGAPARTVAAAAAAAPAAADWNARLRSAEGNDEALLALLLESAPIDVKLAAVGSLTSEDALKRAERELRTHDRRAHRLAKQRHATLIARRETQLRAAQLTDNARALLDEPLIAANRLVELDRAWQALDATLLDAGRALEFDALLTRLTTLTRDRADRALALERWTVAAHIAIDALRSACASVTADATDRDTLAVAEAAAREALDAAPIAATRAEDVTASPEVATLCDAIRDALQESAALSQKIAERAVEVQRAPPPLVREASSQSVDREKAKRHDAHAAAALAQGVEEAEAALAEGHVVEAGRHLSALDALLSGGARADALHTRIDRLHAEVARLKGWQHWGGRLARDELVAQAEALASAGRGASDAQIARLTTRQRSELIGELRARWKELDRVGGGAPNRALWERFDAALKTAYEPVAAQAQAQREARTQNLQARLDLLSGIEVAALPDVDAPQSSVDWKPIAVALANFHAAWRKLGPIEHTVPRSERESVQARLDAAVVRLDGPLAVARGVAQTGRERLIERARVLGAAGGAAATGRDGLDQLRTLQSEWQQAARELPLARTVENALWSDFKVAIDAAHGARNAAFDARDAEFKAQGVARHALIARLEALTDASPADDVRRTLADVESAWRQAGPAPRADAAALDARYRAAGDAARARLAGAAQRAWRARCDALLARLAAHDGSAVVRQPEAAGVGEAASARVQRADLPASWERALARRASSAKASDNSLTGLSNDELLLQLEASLALASPQGFEAARRELKLRAMKAALETRSSAASSLSSANALLVEALAREAFNAAQRDRLRRLVEAMRDHEPMQVD